jgi:DNA invertase Pin-like site-specific DNA recombinase
MDNERVGPTADPLIDLYARLSFAADGSTINVEEQIELGLADITRRRGQPGKIFKDNSTSAWDPKVVRQNWEELMRRLESGASDGVWVLDLTRFSRKIMEGERLVDVARQGRLVWSASGEYNLNTAEGRKVFRKEMVDAAGESDKISERVRRGQRRKARRGFRFNGDRGFAMPRWEPRPDGWERGDPRTRVPDDVVAAERTVIQDCYRRLLAGTATVSAVASELNSRGIVTTTGYVWSRTSLAAMLVRPSLAGLIELNGEIIGTMKDIPPVVSREDWERMCALVAARRPGRPAGRAHVLSGLIRCEDCGSTLYGGVRQGPPYPDGTPKREYRCRRGPGMAGCGRTSIDARAAEAAVEHAVTTRLGDPRRAERMAARAAATAGRRAEIDAEIAYLNREADALSEKVARWGVDRVDRSMEPLLRRVGELTRTLAQLDLPEDPRAVARDVARDWDTAKAVGNIDALRMMIRTAFPNLTLRRALRYMDYDPNRFDWDGTGDRPPLAPHPLDELRALLADPAGLTAKQISAATSWALGVVYRRLVRLEKAGEVAKTPRPLPGDTHRTEGVYRLTGPHPADRLAGRAHLREG